MGLKKADTKETSKGKKRGLAGHFQNFQLLTLIKKFNKNGAWKKITIENF